ncbi:hypothetical protein GWI33_014242 [Rhynchophorus ferrugineus]|uniref:Uncharacterized protein n=1 Tax=Rhynchophorus ferrugineus TaxID=354439 RepID=A0A834M9A3_RHYFE|nr:hypothetical protein GWI33_014242 [Rhynchophorus ferrugineus]
MSTEDDERSGRPKEPPKRVLMTLPDLRTEQLPANYSIRSDICALRSKNHDKKKSELTDAASIELESVGAVVFTS